MLEYPDPSDVAPADGPPRPSSEISDERAGSNDESGSPMPFEAVGESYAILRTIRYWKDTPEQEVLGVFDNLEDANAAAPHLIIEGHDDEFEISIDKYDDDGCAEISVDDGDYVFQLNVKKAPKYAGKDREKISQNGHDEPDTDRQHVYIVYKDEVHNERYDCHTESRVLGLFKTIKAANECIGSAADDLDAEWEDGTQCDREGGTPDDPQLEVEHDPEEVEEEERIQTSIFMVRKEVY